VSVRNNRHWLTAESLKKGLKEQQAWTNVGMEQHTVQLESLHFEDTTTVVWQVSHLTVTPSGVRFQNSEEFGTLTEARERFAKEARH
jgi:hypothetical protein